MFGFPRVVEEQSPIHKRNSDQDDHDIRIVLEDKYKFVILDREEKRKQGIKDRPSKKLGANGDWVLAFTRIEIHDPQEDGHGGKGDSGKRVCAPKYPNDLAVMNAERKHHGTEQDCQPEE